MIQLVSRPILSRSATEQLGPTLLSDFTLGTGDPVAPETLLAPDWSLYGLDLTAGVAIFVAVPPDLDLTTAPFMQIAQFTHALRVITAPLSDLPALAALMPRPERQILMFSTGRCGSTLASRLMAQVPGVISLSEPAAFMTLALARNSMPDDEQARLIAALTRLMYRPRSPQDTVLAIKFHSHVLFQVQHFWFAFPDASYVFQYRNGVSSAASFSRFMQIVNVPLILEGEGIAFNWMMATGGAPLADLQALHDITHPLRHEHLLAPAWALHMDQYLNLRALGVPVFPLRYNELANDPTASARALMAHCGLPLPDDAQLAQVLAQDSQGGTALARVTPAALDPEAALRFCTTLSRAAPHLAPDGMLPALPLVT